MGASLYIGEHFHFVEPGEDGGSKALAGVIDCTNMSWMSIAEVRTVGAERLGIPADAWPFYGDVELEEEFPLNDVLARCARLRVLLASIPEAELPDNAWIRELARYLRNGWDFCAKSW